MKPGERLKKLLGVRYPILCGAMYPCSNPELLSAVAKAGAMAVVQPISLTYVYGRPFREGLRDIRRQAGGAPLGMNVLVEASSEVYLERMRKVVDESLEEGVRFFVTALGNPDWVVKKVHAAGGVVFHDVTEKKWAQKALDAGVDGFICVNNRAGGHAGTRSPEALFEELESLGKPLICAGGVGSPEDFRRMLDLGYEGVQMGTRFIATQECRASDEYKAAILKAKASDVVLTDRISGVPVSVIRTPHVEKVGTKAGLVTAWMLRHPKLKHWVRTWYTLRSAWGLKRSIVKPGGYADYWQAGKSVDGIERIETAAEVVERFAKVLNT